jgi:hypothetical protein
MKPRVLPLALVALAALSACTTSAPRGDAFGAPEAAVYQGIQTRLLEGDLVNFVVQMQGARDEEDVVAYARCAAAQYALIRGYGFARHVSTNVLLQGDVWTGDAVYTILPSLPRGFRTIDAEVTVADCIEQGIPTV